jgi:hypothetical protein
MFFDICHWPTTNGFSLFLDPTFVINAGQLLKIIKFQSSAVKIIVGVNHKGNPSGVILQSTASTAKYEKYKK